MIKVDMCWILLVWLLVVTGGCSRPQDGALGQAGSLSSLCSPSRCSGLFPDISIVPEEKHLVVKLYHNH